MQFDIIVTRVLYEWLHTQYKSLKTVRLPVKEYAPIEYIQLLAIG